MKYSLRLAREWRYRSFPLFNSPWSSKQLIFCIFLCCRGLLKLHIFKYTHFTIRETNTNIRTLIFTKLICVLGHWPFLPMFRLRALVCADFLCSPWRSGECSDGLILSHTYAFCNFVGHIFIIP